MAKITFQLHPSPEPQNHTQLDQVGLQSLLLLSCQKTSSFYLPKSWEDKQHHPLSANTVLSSHHKLVGEESWLYCSPTLAEHSAKHFILIYSSRIITLYTRKQALRIEVTCLRRCTESDTAGIKICVLPAIPGTPLSYFSVSLPR